LQIKKDCASLVECLKFAETMGFMELEVYLSYRIVTLVYFSADIKDETNLCI
jgi:hypothetical protein